MIDLQVKTKNGHIKYGFIAKPDINLDYYFYRAREYAENNRKLAAKFIDPSLKDILVIEQIHSNRCHAVKGFIDLKGDAMATKVKSLPIAVQTADCVPVILYDAKNMIVGIAHAGWRGAFSGVINNTVKNMLSIGAEIKSIEAVIGPAIDQKSYEVDSDFYKNFIRQCKDNEKFFIPSVNHYKFMFDLKGYCYKNLEELGMSDIKKIDLDTYQNTDKFFSYRKQCHLGHNKLDGHILSYVVIL